MHDALPDVATGLDKVSFVFTSRDDLEHLGYVDLSQYIPS
jgi:hypothetical protein